MGMIDGKHICHLSLLNPAVHSRIFFKMARTQVAAGFRVTIIAQDSARVPYKRDGVTIVPLGVFGRLSWRRICSVGRLRRMAKKLKADVYQIHTVELLGVGKQLKQALPQAKVVYDVHEDYVANILYADYYAEWSRAKLADRVRVAQDDFQQWGDGLIYAEKCFEGLIPFDSNRTVVVQNKYQPPNVDEVRAFQLPVGMPMMLVSGTLAENWGIFNAIDLWIAINRLHPLVLVMAGHSQDANLVDEAIQRAKESGFGDRFLMVGGKSYVPYEEIVALTKVCTFGVALYALKANIKERIPTKFFEFMAHQKPILFTANEAWDDLNEQLDFGMSISWPPTQDNIVRIVERFLMKPNDFYRKPISKTDWSWETESQAMLDLMRKILAGES
jgi:glycosyltransferase involved in cell wall biosynthesis